MIDYPSRGWMLDSKSVMVAALRETGFTERQSKLVVMFGLSDAEQIDDKCDVAIHRARLHDGDEYMVCRIRFPSPLNGDEFWVGEYDEVGSLEGDVTPIWSSSDGFNFDPECVCF